MKFTALACILFSWVLARAEFQYYKANTQRTGFYGSAQFNTPLMMSWQTSKRTGDDTRVQYSSPVVGQDKIYIGNSNGNIEAYYRAVNSFNSFGEAENVAWMVNIRLIQ